MTITAKIIADSTCNEKHRITTMQLRYPRFIHSELMTYRVFSRNASSSRAIPVERLIQDVLDDTAIPIHWGANQRGMQAENEMESGEWHWIAARNAAVDHARLMSSLGYHKQIVNRIIEPFAHINVLVTSTKWDNFFAQRDHKDAQPEIKALAVAMKNAMAASTPRDLEYGEWHLPYIKEDERDINGAQMISAARCARVSYLTHEGVAPSIQDDLALFERLASGSPMHASPMEHQATPCTNGDDVLSRNFKGWAQYRAILEGSR